MKIIASIAAAALLSVSLSSCITTSDDTQTKIEKAYAAACAGEPAVYAAYVAVRSSNGKLPATGVVDADAIVTRLCADRPTDILTASVTLLSAYAQIVAAK